MSFDLYMHRPTGSPPLNEEEVHRVVMGLPYISKMTQGQWMYENPQTGVCFLAELDVGDEADPPLKDQCPFLVINLNYARPTFFALEAMPVATEIARSLGLQMWDTQGPSDDPVIRQSTPELIESWCHNNEFAVRALVADGSAPIGAGSVKSVATLEQMTYWWRYAQMQPEIDEKLKTEDVFTPQIILVRARGGTNAERLVCWADCISTVIPETELLLIRRRRPGLLGLGTRQEDGVVKFSEMYDILGDALVRQTDPLPHYIYRQHELSKEVKQAIAQLRLVPFDSYEGLLPESIVDVGLDDA